MADTHEQNAQNARANAAKYRAEAAACHVNDYMGRPNPIDRCDADRAAQNCDRLASKYRHLAARARSIAAASDLAAAAASDQS